MAEVAARSDWGATRGLQWLVVAVLWALGAAAAWMIWRPPPTSSWISVEVEGPPAVGRPLRVRTHVTPAYAGMYVGVDLHWATTRHESRGFLSTAPVVSAPVNGEILEFELAVSERPDLGHVYAVAYVGPNGRWEDRRGSATSVWLPVVNATDGTTASRWQPWPMYDPEQRPAPAESSMSMRWLAATALLAAACLGRVPRQRPGRPADSPRARLFARVLMGLCIVAALWELLDLTSHGAALAEHAAMGSSHYHERHGLQRWLTFAAVVTALGLMAFVVVRPLAPGKRLLAIALTVFYAVAASRIISLHAIDVVLLSPWQGVPLWQWANLVASGLAAFGALQMALRGAGGIMPPRDA